MFNFFLRLIEPLRSQKWRDAQQQKEFEAVFDDIPSDSERRRMSEKELAEVLSTCKVGTPAYILIEHELNLRIARIQSRATLRSGWLGLIGALLGAALGFFLGTLSPKETSDRICKCKCGSQIERPVNEPQPPASTGVVPVSKDIDVKPGDSNGQKKHSN